MGSIQAGASKLSAKKKTGWKWRGRELRRSRASQIIHELDESGSGLLRVPKSMEIERGVRQGQEEEKGDG